jgi:proteasome accessory factor A
MAGDLAGPGLVGGSLEPLRRAATVPGSMPIQLCKNNADSAGNSYGCHENYLAGRHGEFGRLTDILTFDVGRSIAVR